MKKSYGSVEIGEIEESSGGIQNKNNNNCTALEAASNQIAVVTGAGMLSLPYAASAMGWSVLVLLFILTLCFCYSYLLLVYSIDRVLLRNQGTDLTVDYAFLAREAFGAGGDRWVLVILISELFLALVSFLINIGLNVHIILPFVDVATAILCATAIATALSFADLKILSRVTAFGNVMTTLTVVAVALSGMYLPETGDLDSSTPEWKTFDAKGIAVSLGVMAYCFGGHGAFPKIYQSMSNPEHVPITISTVAAFVFILYAVIISLGYLYYGSSTMIPVTLNLGKDLQGNDLPSARMLSMLASLGLVFNIQATCPLIVITITDMIMTTFGSFNPAPVEPHMPSGPSPQKYVFLVLCVSAMIVALFLREDFLEVCGLIGSFATIASSIFLPIAFYHRLHPLAETSSATIALHLLLTVLALCAMFVGLASSVCGITHSASALSPSPALSLCCGLLKHL